MKVIVTGANGQLGRAVVALPGEGSMAALPVHRYLAGRSPGALAAGASRSATKLRAPHLGL